MTLKKSLQGLGEVESRHLLDDIVDLIEDDIKFIRDKNQDKAAQKKILKRALSRARNRYISEENVGNEPSKETKKALNAATAVYNKFSYLEIEEGRKLSEYARIIIDIEKYKREDNEYHGISNLSDEELIKRSRHILQVYSNDDKPDDDEA